MNQLIKIPRPGQLPLKIREGLKVLLVSDAVNNLTRRVQTTLEDYGVNCHTVEAISSDNIVTQKNNYEPDLIICPYLTTYVPEQIYSDPHQPCLIVHPGIVGDMGASSLDWAILTKEKQWGVTVLQADAKFDNGSIWSSKNFSMPQNSIKSALYNGHITDTAIDCVLDAVSRFSQQIEAIPRQLCQDVQGSLRRNMKHSDRLIDWEMSSNEITRRVRMSDTTPGAIGSVIAGPIANQFRLFDAYPASGSSRSVQRLLRSAKPGQMVAVRNKSILFKCGEHENEGVWIGQMKMNKGLSCKLPSTDILPSKLIAKTPRVLLPCDHDEIQVIKKDAVCYVYFDFYNGAMDCQQAAQLEATLKRVSIMDDVKVVALMGGERFFSTGIHLCKIASSDNIQQEAWLNITAIDSVIKAMLQMTHKATVAVIRGNAGAGGAMFAAACDIVLTYEGSCLTPSYKAMNLYGSEYWTYFLPRRVGVDLAQTLVAGTTPLSAKAAQKIGLVDHIIASNKATMEDETVSFLENILDNGRVEAIINSKSDRNDDWFKILQKHRDAELSNMIECFRSDEFLGAMRNFVYKIKPTQPVN